MTECLLKSVTFSHILSLCLFMVLFFKISLHPWLFSLYLSVIHIVFFCRQFLCFFASLPILLLSVSAPCFAHDSLYLCIFVSLSLFLFYFCFLTFVSLSLSLSALCLLLYFLFFACFFVSLYTYFALSVCFVRLILTLTWNKGRTMLRSPVLIIPWILNVKGL